MLFTEMKRANFWENEECACTLEGDDTRGFVSLVADSCSIWDQKKVAQRQRALERGYSGKIERSEQEVDVLLIWQELLLKSGIA